MAIILGIDPGSRFTGFGIIESNGQHSRHIHSGVLKLGSAPFPERLGKIFAGLQTVILEYQPVQMAIENVFVSKNPSSALKLGQARGAAICAGVMNGLEVAEYTPREVKQAVVGKGAADKSQVQHMTKILLNLSGELQEDRADALGVALCHAHTWAFQKKIQIAEQGK
ncbi:MAG: Crossover junction endodeoxyribonuclease RuvC (EC [uncultured Thiotrichaceae bacterium]|uniref:Crossover junction endodeoxyribonuclease RuvC n=1 Tax=uncultured Thiotrichaceae bacterium TaxID=298394 RepID=A0A6S6TN12_9GAMM|nr:MAG: Crossover junction endodeoxyribonuclease RuvC (EC [uncultured Thiotrichaceae bacterium]